MSYVTKLNPNNFESIVSRFMESLDQVIEQMKEDGLEVNRVFSRWNLEQSIINRLSSKTMMEAAEDWLEQCENTILHENGMSRDD